MKRALRFGVLVGVLAVGFWSSGSQEAGAIGDCMYMSGKGCSPAGSQQSCVYYEYPDTYYGVCTCTSSNRWSCAF